MTTILAILNKYGYVYVEGLIGTLLLSLITVFFASILGTIIALMRMSKSKILNAITGAYLWLIRGTPILLQLYFFWLLLPKVLPFELSDTGAIIVAMIINAASYIAEIVRSGVESVDKGQIEAAKSLGLKPSNIYKKIIFPQAIRTILPALGNQYIATIKQTSLASVFFVAELTTSYRTVQSATFQAIPAIVIAGIIYLLIIGILNKGLELMERRLKIYG